MITAFRALLLLLSLLAGVEPALAATYYVSPPSGSPSGSDARSCMTAQTIGTPKATLNNAVGCLLAGDTLLVRAGSYAEMLHTNITTIASGTSWSNKTRIAAYPGETVWMRPVGTIFVVYLGSAYTPQYIEFDGINMDGTSVTGYTFKIEAGSGYDAHHIRLKNSELIGPNTGGCGCSTIIVYKNPGNETGGGSNEFQNNIVHDGGRLTQNQDHGFYVGTSDNIIEDNTVYRAAGFGIQIWNENKNQSLITIGPQRNIVRRNRVYGGIVGSGGGGGIVCGTDTDTEVYNNVVYDITKGGFTADILVFNSSGCHVQNNTLYNGVMHGVYVDSSTSGAVVRNNISYGNASTNYSNSGSGTTASNNLLGTDPQFVSVGTNNFRLQAGSPAINAGMTVSAVITDADSVARPQAVTYDIGAYEYIFTLGPVPAPPTGLHVAPR